MNETHYEYAKLLLESGASINDLNPNFSPDEKTNLEIYINECYNRIQQLEMSHSDEINFLSNKYKYKLDKRNKYIESLKRQRNESYDAIIDLKDMELQKETKKTHDAFQELKQYDKETKKFTTINNILFGILLSLIIVCLSIYILNNKEKVEQMAQNFKGAAYEYGRRVAEIKKFLK